MAYCHKHGQGQWSGRCTVCDDELISLGIQADKDKIAELERLLRNCADELAMHISCCKGAPTIKNRAWQLRDKALLLLGEV